MTTTQLVVLFLAVLALGLALFDRIKPALVVAAVALIVLVGPALLAFRHR